MKPYKTLDDVPQERWNIIVICLKHGKDIKASSLLHNILIQIRDIPQFEVWMLCRKLKSLAGV